MLIAGICDLVRGSSSRHEFRMPSYTLTDLARDLWVDSIAITPGHVGLTTSHAWSVHKQTLRGGRRDGVDLILVNNGPLSFSVVPTRGMGLWRGQYRGSHIGWDSPIADGPVHPSFVNLAAAGGLGWLDGFDEVMARCGLEHNGAPYQEGQITYPLHGRIANIPAHFVAIHVGEKPPHELMIEGCVDEARLFGPTLRMLTRISTTLGSNRLTVRDEFSNVGDLPRDLQILYHWNFGPPYLEEGSRLLAPARTIIPRDERAVEGLGHFDVYGPPRPGSAEQVYFFDLHATAAGESVLMLRTNTGDKAVALRFNKTGLPAFTLWKNTAGRKDGYVTGLEPGTNYPNPKPFEKARNRVISLAPGATYITETTLEVLDSKAAVAAVEAEIKLLQKQGAPTILPKPVEPYAPQ
jgi:hypothetical protein